MACHGLLGSFALKLAFSNSRTVYNMKRIVVCSAILGMVETMQKKKKKKITKQRKFHQVKVTSFFFIIK